jgi:proteasome assembly chaperone (PAC2) family protein
MSDRVFDELLRAKVHMPDPVASIEDLSAASLLAPVAILRDLFAICAAGYNGGFIRDHRASRRVLS